MSVVVETNDPGLKSARYQDVQRKTTVTASAHNGQPNTFVQSSFLNFYLRLRYASGALRLVYRVLLSTVSSALV